MSEIVEKAGNGEQSLPTIRQTATTVEGALALKEPIVYFYTVGVDSEDRIVLIKSRQMLNDKFLGRMIPEHYTAVAEMSDRLERLNLLEIEEIKKVNDDYTRYFFEISISCKLLLKEELVQKVLELAKKGAENIALSFNASTIDTLDKDAKVRLKELREAGFKIMLEGIENAPIRVLTEIDADFIRLDFRFYKQRTPSQTKQVEALIKLAKARGMKVVCAYIKHMGEAKFMINLGADIAEGYAFGEPRRSIYEAMEERRQLKGLDGK